MNALTEHIENKMGRPTVMTESVIAKLEEAFINGASDKEAIFLAGISKDSFYDYCKLYPEFNDRIEGLRNMPKYKARKNLTSAIDNGDKPISQWYLERKAKDEFSTRTEQTGADGKDLIPETNERIKQLADELRKRNE